MKYIITEEQYDRVVNKNVLFWIKRRYDLVEKALKETYKLTKFDICRIDDYEKFEKKFFTVMMDCLHPFFYDDESFTHLEYDMMCEVVLKDLFYVECTEFYFAGRRKC
jgi:hypothetical protein